MYTYLLAKQNERIIVTESLKILSNFYAPYLEEFDIVLFNGKRHDSSYFSNQPTMLFSQVIANLPEGWEPDIVLFHTPFYYKIPIGIEESPWPTVAVLDDWFGGVDFMPDVLGWFDHIVTDRYSMKLLQERGIENYSYWASFGHDDSRFRLLDPVPERDIDISFVGNLNGNIQYERFAWLRRCAEVPFAVNSQIGTGIFGDDYVEVLNRSKIGFNRSIKGEMNLRCFEVPACGALLFIEEENEEIREFLEPGKECILYNDSNLESLLEYYLSHDTERETIAAAGQKRIVQTTFRDNYRDLITQLSEMTITPGSNRHSGKFYTQSSNHLHLIQTALGGAGQDEQLLNRLAHFIQTPEGKDPLFLNDMAVLLANYGETAPGLDSASRSHCFQQAHELFNAVLAMEPAFLTAKFNRMQMKTRLHKDLEVIQEARAITKTEQGSTRGLIFPLNYTFPLRYLWSQALAEPAQYNRIALLHHFSFLTISDMYERQSDIESAYTEILNAYTIYPKLPYVLKKLARNLLQQGREELFQDKIEEALNSTPFDNEVLHTILTCLERCGDAMNIRSRLAVMFSALTSKTKSMLPGIEDRLQ